VRENAIESPQRSCKNPSSPTGAPASHVDSSTQHLRTHFRKPVLGSPFLFFVSIAGKRSQLTFHAQTHVQTAVSHCMLFF
jgi:hypothetical protein